MSFDPTLDRPLVLACLRDFDAGPGQEPAALELAQAAGVVVGDALHDDGLTGATFTERTLAKRSHFARQAGDGMAVGIELRAAEQLEYARLHPLRDHVLETLRLLVHLVPCIAE